jgi:hypothetical protein
MGSSSLLIVKGIVQLLGVSGPELQAHIIVVDGTIR